MALQKTPTVIHMMHSSSSVDNIIHDADLICLEITRVVNKLTDFLANEALIIMDDVCVMYSPQLDASMKPTIPRHYFTLKDTSI